MAAVPEVLRLRVLRAAPALNQTVRPTMHVSPRAENPCAVGNCAGIQPDPGRITRESRVVAAEASGRRPVNYGVTEDLFRLLSVLTTAN